MAHGAGPAPAHISALRLEPADLRAAEPGRGWANEAKRRAWRQVGGYRRDRVVHGDREIFTLRIEPGRLSVEKVSAQLRGYA